MFSTKLTMKRIAIATLGAIFLTTTSMGTAFADPPRWAKSHGHYKKVHHKHGHWKRAHKHRRNQRSRVVYQESQPIQAGNFSKTMGGGILGAIIGAAVGTQFGKGSGRTAAVLGGAVIGAVLGGNIGQQMEASDRQQSQAALETAPNGQAVAWQNPNTGAQYKVTPNRTYQSAQGKDCRDYTTWVFIDGYEEQVQGAACRSTDGKWTSESNS